MLIIGGSGSWRTNSMLNLVKEKDSDNLIDKIYLYVKDLNELKYQFLIKKREGAGMKYLNDPKPFIQDSNAMNDVYNNTDHYNPTRKKKVSCVW